MSMHHYYNMLRLAVSALVLILSVAGGHAQRQDTARWAVKTNIAGWAVATPNIGAEAGLSPHHTMDMSLYASPFTFGHNHKWKHWQAIAEARWWLRKRFDGHFFGLHVGGGEFNISRVSTLFGGFDSDYRYEGWNLRAGLSYGYQWVLGRRWNIEAMIGLGVIYADYDRFDCAYCGKLRDHDSKAFFAPTNAAVSLIYTFGRHKEGQDAEPPAQKAADTERPVAMLVPRAVALQSRAAEAGYPFLRRLGTDSAATRGVSVRFRVNSHDIDRQFSSNAATLDDLIDAISLVCCDCDSLSQLDHISIVGYASPEGTEEHNNELAVSRATALRDYVKDSLHIDEGRFRLVSGGEDWQGLRTLVEKSDMRLKDRIIDIIDNAPRDERKQLLARLDNGRAWTSIHDVLFPQLRDACYINVWYRELDDRAAAAINGAIDDLHAGRNQDALAKLEKVGHDWRSWNARGAALWSLGRQDEARSWMRRAADAGDDNARANLRLLGGSAE